MSLTLSYFDFDGSRGLECRVALRAAGLPFTDERLSREQWGARKPATPFGAMPVLSDGARVLSQSNAILGYIGRERGLLPADPWRAAEHVALMESVEDLRNKLPNTKGLEADAARAAREAFAAGWLSQWARSVSAAIEGPFLDGDRLSVADIKLYVILRAFRSGAYDHIPGSFFDAWPKLLALYAAVDAHSAARG
jgi:prostaglandin-H2 D-isomerase / glutathione transferase